MTTIITQTISKIILPLGILFSIALLFAGHNKPGGGFIAGVLLASIIALQYISFGMDHIKSFFNPDWAKWFAFGLIFATLIGTGALALGHNFLRSGFIAFHHVPIFGEIEIVSAGFFDIGIFFVVVGSLLYIFQKVGEDK